MHLGRRSGERNLSGARRKNGVLDSRYGAKRLQWPLAGIEEAGVAHDAANALRRPDHLGVASGRFQDAENPRIEDRHDLRQPRGHCDLADPQYELA